MIALILLVLACTGKAYHSGAARNLGQGKHLKRYFLKGNCLG